MSDFTHLECPSCGAAIRAGDAHVCARSETGEAQALAALHWTQLADPFAEASGIAAAWLDPMNPMAAILPDVPRLAAAVQQLITERKQQYARGRLEALLSVAGTVEMIMRRTKLQECTERCDDEWCSHALYGVESEGWNAALDAVVAMLAKKAVATETAI